LIPEPEDHEILEDFLEWEGLLQSLNQIEEELKDL
jgi:hypothetical protein